jgi:hypothetical protein
MGCIVDGNTRIGNQPYSFESHIFVVKTAE